MFGEFSVPPFCVWVCVHRHLEDGSWCPLYLTHWSWCFQSNPEKKSLTWLIFLGNCSRDLLSPPSESGSAGGYHVHPASTWVLVMRIQSPCFGWATDSFSCPQTAVPMFCLQKVHHSQEAAAVLLTHSQSSSILLTNCWRKTALPSKCTTSIAEGV